MLVSNWDAHVAEQLLLALPTMWANLPAGAQLTPQEFRGKLAQEAGVDVSAADECKRAVNSLISVLRNAAGDDQEQESGLEQAVDQQRADTQIHTEPSCARPALWATHGRSGLPDARAFHA